MKYNPFGYRFYSGNVNEGNVFLYSSQGQLVAKYKVSGNTLKLNYLPIYEGSKRIGIVEPEDVSWLDCPELMPCDVVAVDPCMLMVEGQPKPPCEKDSSLKADRKYEIVDHLGNVRVVIANQRVPVDTNGDSLVDYYKPMVINVHDYYPFGWEKTLTQDPYPFTYQGQLFDKELGWQYYRYRNYDPMIARFWQVEPLIDKYPWLGYVFSENRVINGIELEGLEYVSAYVWASAALIGWFFGERDWYYSFANYMKFKILQKLVREKKIYCYESCLLAYAWGNRIVAEYLLEQDIPVSRCNAIQWFRRGGPFHWFIEDFEGFKRVYKGDILFMGKCESMAGHAALVADSIKFEGDTIMIVPVLSTGAGDDYTFGYKEYIFKRYGDVWIEMITGYRLWGFGRVDEIGIIKEYRNKRNKKGKKPSSKGIHTPRGR